MNYDISHNHFTVPIFRPTWDEFKNFTKYIDYIETQNAHKIGLAKIIPPKEWCARRNGYNDIDDLKISSPICQRVNGREGIYTQFNIQQKSMKLKEFETLAKSSKYSTPSHTDNDDLERKYWKNLTFIPAIYGADISGSLTDPDQEYWNINKLGTILDDIKEEYNLKIEGVNTAYLYFGMWKSTFAWHTEDMDLYSINYLHFGAPKSWYVIPPEHGKRLERLAMSFFPHNARECNAFLRHKMTVISPRILNKYSIPYSKITQYQNEFIITFPYGYHSGYNHGFNCAESTNFAMPRWIDYGKKATQCFCCKDMVKIKMDIFVKKYQPEKYDLWLLGLENTPHPVDLMRHGGESCSNNMTGLIGKKRFQISEKLNPQNNKRKRLNSISYDYFHKLALVNSDKLCVVDENDENMSNKRYGDLRLPFNIENCLNNSLNCANVFSLKYLSAQKALNLINRLNQDDTMHVCESMSNVGVNDEKIDDDYMGSNDNDDMKMMNMANDLNDLKCLNAYNEFMCVNSEYKEKAENLNGLWNFQNININKIREFNLKQSTKYPHCSICLLFKESCSTSDQVIIKNELSLALVYQNNDKYVENKPLPKNSEILIPEICFTKRSKNFSKLPDFQGHDNIDCLLQCKNCNVTVHQSCYFGFIDDPTIDKQNWLCNSCLSTDYEFTYCSLCMLRGGALKQTTDKKRWAHVTCALCIEGIIFKDSRTRSIIQISKQLLYDKKIQVFNTEIKHEAFFDNQNLIVTFKKCNYCNYFSKYRKLSNKGITVKCNEITCKMKFHVTCGQAFGCKFDNADWPLCIYYLCDKHVKTGNKRQISAFHEEIIYENGTEFNLQQSENNFLKKAKIIDRDIQMHYEVDFGDGTYSSDMLPEDIQDLNDGVPEAGSIVKVKWTDGEIYSCTFLGFNKTYIYTLEFDDGKQIKKTHKELNSLSDKNLQSQETPINQYTEDNDVDVEKLSENGDTTGDSIGDTFIDSDNYDDDDDDDYQERTRKNRKNNPSTKKKRKNIKLKIKKVKKK